MGEDGFIKSFNSLVLNFSLLGIFFAVGSCCVFFTVISFTPLYSHRNITDDEGLSEVLALTLSKKPPVVASVTFV
jgi:hypothetical protein